MDVLAAELAVLHGDAVVPPPAASGPSGSAHSLTTAGLRSADLCAPAAMHLRASMTGPEAMAAAAAAGIIVPPAAPLCAVCGFAAKYACGTCAAPYCSAGCVATHRDSGRCLTSVSAARR